MEDSHRIKIQRNLIALSKGVNLERLYPLLIEEGIILRDDVESLQKKFPERDAQAYEFYLWYTKRGPTAFETLTKSLRTLGYITEADILETDSVSATTPSRPIGEWQEIRSGDEKSPEFIDIRNSTPPEASADANTNGEFTYLDIHVKPAKVYNNGQTEHTYQMMSRPRGFALIVNNIHFKNKSFPYRRGAEVDSVNMRSLLEPLGFEVTVRHDLEKRDFFTELENFKEKFTRARVDACIVSIMSHGHENIIEMCDPVSATVDIWDDVIRRFNNKHCRALMGKPKIFFIQCCRGDLYDFGVPRTEPDCGSLSSGLQQSNTGAPTKPYQPPVTIKLEPEFKDILLCYATIPGYVANRATDTGTWYTRTLCEVFMNDAHNTELKKLLDKVGRRMEEIVSELGNLQTPSYKSIGFNRDLYFNPGLYADTSHLPG